jgi:hypothetical protein
LIVTHEELTQWVNAVEKCGIRTLHFTFNGGDVQLVVVRNAGKDKAQAKLLKHLQKRLASLETIADRRAFMNALASAQPVVRYEQQQRDERRAIAQATDYEMAQAVSMSDTTPALAFQFIRPTIH